VILERGEFESIQHFRAEKRSLEAAAKGTLQKDERINIRISSDLEKLQKRAVIGRDPLSDADRQHLAQLCNW
jgi:predicted DNA binding CopG/RHH family protein